MLTPVCRIVLFHRAAVAGCLRCLSVMAVDLDSEQAPQLMQSLSAELAELVSSPHTPPGLSATCFNIMAQLTSALASLSGAYQKQVRPQWEDKTRQHNDPLCLVDAALSTLQSPLTSQHSLCQRTSE